MKPPGVVVNLRAGGVRRDPDLVKGLRKLLPSGHLETTRSPVEIDGALARLRASGLETLAVVGGDGTATWTLTSLMSTWPAEDRPSLLFLRGGTVNTIPMSVSGRAPPLRALERFVASGRLPPASSRSILQVRADGGEPRWGMIFGTGLLARWLAGYNSHMHNGPIDAARDLGRVLGSAVVGGPLARSLLAPFSARIEIDGEPEPVDQITGLAAGAVRHIGLGFQPFLSIPRTGTVGGFHWISTRNRGLGMLLELPAARLGLRSPFSGLHHARARSARVELAEPQAYTLDGDLFSPAREIQIEVGPTLSFLRADS